MSAPQYPAAVLEALARWDALRGETVAWSAYDALCAALDAFHAEQANAPTPNMCDGCQRGLPLVDGIHHGSLGYGLIGCTAERYGHSPLIGDPTRDAFRESAMREAEDASLRDASGPQPHRFGGIL